MPRSSLLALHRRQRHAVEADPGRLLRMLHIGLQTGRCQTVKLLEETTQIKKE